MQIYVVVAPAEFGEASRFGRAFAHMAYRMGDDSSLLRQNLLLQTRGGLLALSDRGAPAVSAPDRLAAAIVRECGRRSYAGVLLDFESAPSRDRQALTEQLSRDLPAGRRTLFVPERWAKSAPAATPLVCTALSGGNFAEHLRESAASYGGPDRTALDVQLLRMDFRLPAPSGEGTLLSAQALEDLRTRENPAVFFSQDLCARYFTYARGGETHFVLFDDADTLNQKLRMGAAMGFAAAFVMWPEIRDIAGRLNLR